MKGLVPDRLIFKPQFAPICEKAESALPFSVAQVGLPDITIDVGMANVGSTKPRILFWAITLPAKRAEITMVENKGVRIRFDVISLHE